MTSVWRGPSISVGPASIAPALLAAALLAGCPEPTERRLDAARASSEALAADGQLDCSAPLPGYETLEAFARGVCPQPVARASAFAPGCVPAAAFETWGCLLVDTTVTLCGGTYNLTALFTESDVSLIGGGSIIDHGWGPACEDGADAGTHDCSPPRAAVKLPRERSLQAVRIADLTIRNVGYSALELHRYFLGVAADGDAMGAALDGETLIGHSDVVIENVVVENAKAGVYVGQGARRTTIRDSRFENTRYFGVYLEAYSEQAVLQNLVFAGNQSERAALPYAALVIDSSSHNVIERSRFERNRHGDVELYRNCGELKAAARVCPIRRVEPHHNVFRDNEFSGSVRVASRQGMAFSENYCLDLGGESGRHADSARSNSFVGNAFRGPLFIHSSDNAVYLNRFLDGASECGVRISSGQMPPGSVNLSGTTLSTNTFRRCALESEAARGDVRHNRTTSGACLGAPRSTCGPPSSWPALIDP